MRVSLLWGGTGFVAETLYHMGKEALFFHLSLHYYENLKEALIMALETKVILLAILRIIKQSKSLEEVYEAVLELANAEGVSAEPLKKEDGK
jgi:hypothetical protein